MPPLRRTEKSHATVTRVGFDRRLSDVMACRIQPQTFASMLYGVRLHWDQPARSANNYDWRGIVQNDAVFTIYNSMPNTGNFESHGLWSTFTMLIYYYWYWYIYIFLYNIFKHAIHVGKICAINIIVLLRRFLHSLKKYNLCWTGVIIIYGEVNRLL